MKPQFSPRKPPAASSVVGTVLQPLDRFFTLVYGARWNPVHYSGALAILFFLILIVTGLYLFLFYSIGEPHASVGRIQEQVYAGRWIRALHRYASDAAVMAVTLHALKMLAEGKTWGPRAIAWISGVLLAGLMLLCGWTGMIMAWDTQGLLIAFHGARMLDLLPIFSQPISRSFIQAGTMPMSFFFMNLFLHVALPLGLTFLLWLHSSRVARPKLFPEKGVAWTAGLTLVAVSILWPVPMLPAADLMAIPGRIEMDLFYAFWIPVAKAISPGAHLALWGGAGLAFVALPWYWRPKQREIPKSKVDIDRCTGCTQCYEDCPYDAISMIPRKEPSKLSEVVADVNPDACVSCGICAASCAPMGIGPLMQDGRNQLRAAEAFVAVTPPRPDLVVVMGCSYSHTDLKELPNVCLYSTGCSGAVHTSVIELLIRRGYGGVYVLSCGPNDCNFREGPTWLEQRVFHDREAELKNRVDKRRVFIGMFSKQEHAKALVSVREFQTFVGTLAAAQADNGPAGEDECNTQGDAV